MDARSFAAGFGICFVLLIFSLAAANNLQPQGAAASNFSCPSVEPLFSPDSSEEIISLMRSAQKSIDLEVYTFSDDALARELVGAQKRGVEVRVILEGRIESAATAKRIADSLGAGGVQVRWASLQYALTHSKMMVVDGKKVLVGSINFSKNAQHKNREAAAIIESADKAAAYSSVFEKDWKDAMAVAPA